MQAGHSTPLGLTHHALLAYKATMPGIPACGRKRTPVDDMRQMKPDGPALRRGWTTGACATAAVKAAFTALITGRFPDPVSITLPKGETPNFALADESLSEQVAMAAIVKDAGDDPDVTHGATVRAFVRRLPAGEGICFKAGAGVGVVTRAGLPVAVGEPAINPVPRAMMRAEIEALCATHGVPADVELTIAIDGGEALAAQTWNPRLGIVGGLSVLGTTGIVHPFSCSAWIHSIHRGVDVARAAGLTRIIGATGSASEAAAQAVHGVPEIGLIDMGDFAGGLLKYVRENPVAQLTIAGGFAKMAKLAQGALDLHSGRSQVDFPFLANCAEAALGKRGTGLNQEMRARILTANTALEVLEIMGEDAACLAAEIAIRGHDFALQTLRGAPVSVEIIVTDRAGAILARHG